MMSGNEIIVMTEDQTPRLASLEFSQQFILEIKLIANDIRNFVRLTLLIYGKFSLYYPYSTSYFPLIAILN